MNDYTQVIELLTSIDTGVKTMVIGMIMYLVVWFIRSISTPSKSAHDTLYEKNKERQEIIKLLEEIKKQNGETE
jgi:hypothetical protein